MTCGSCHGCQHGGPQNQPGLAMKQPQQQPLMPKQPQQPLLLAKQPQHAAPMLPKQPVLPPTYVMGKPPIVPFYAYPYPNPLLLDPRTPLARLADKPDLGMKTPDLFAPQDLVTPPPLKSLEMETTPAPAAPSLGELALLAPALPSLGGDAPADLTAPPTLEKPKVQRPALMQSPANVAPPSLPPLPDQATSPPLPPLPKTSTKPAGHLGRLPG
jgi:hypothetical protein